MMRGMPMQVPVEEYISAADALGCAPELVRAISLKESWLHEENPADVRFERARWKRYRFASRAAKAFDRHRNPNDRSKRWLAFEEMDKICQADAILNERAGDAAIFSHSIGWCQIMGFNHRFCDFELARNWLAAMQTLQGQRECFIAFVRSNDTLLRAFQTRNYAVIALHYNGRDYARNKYDRDIAKFDVALQKNGVTHVMV